MDGWRCDRICCVCPLADTEVDNAIEVALERTRKLLNAKREGPEGGGAAKVAQILQQVPRIKQETPVSDGGWVGCLVTIICIWTLLGGDDLSFLTCTGPSSCLQMQLSWTGPPSSVYSWERRPVDKVSPRTYHLQPLSKAD